jgi:hypothetical protein
MRLRRIKKQLLIQDISKNDPKDHEGRGKTELMLVLNNQI